MIGYCFCQGEERSHCRAAPQGLLVDDLTAASPFFFVKCGGRSSLTFPVTCNMDFQYDKPMSFQKVNPR